MTYKELIDLATQIRDNSTAASNTAELVGSTVLAVIQYFQVRSGSAAIDAEVQQALELIDQAGTTATGSINTAKEDALDAIAEAIEGLEVHYDIETDKGAVKDVQLKDGSGNKLMPRTDAVGKYAEIDLLKLPFVLYAMSSGTNWYRGSNKKQGHVAIPVTPGEMYKIQAIDGYKAEYGYMTSSYTPPTSGSRMPFLSGEQTRTVDVDSSVVITIPEGCAYLILNSFSGDYTQCKFRLFKKEQYQFAEKFDEDEANNIFPSDELVQLDLSEIAEQYCTLGNTSWYLDYSTDTPQRHLVIPVEPKSKIRLVNNDPEKRRTIVGFLKTYTIPIANGAFIDYSSFYNERILTPFNADITFTVPPDAHYFILTLVDGSGGTQGRNSVIYVSKQKNIKQGVPDCLMKKTPSRKKLEYPFISMGHFIITNSPYVWKKDGRSQYAGTFVYVGHLRGKVLTFVNTLYTLRFAFLQSRAVQHNITPRFCTGTSFVNINSEGTYQFIVPDDCMWMYLYSYSEGTFLHYDITYEDDGVSTDNFQATEKVDLYSLELKDCATTTDGTWYNDDLANHKHIAIPVTPNEYIRIKGTVAHYVFVSDAYTGTYTNGDTVPYTTDYTCHYTYGGEEVIQVPSSAAYVIINARCDSADGPVDFRDYISFERGNLIKSFTKTVGFTSNSNRLRIASWNIGHFSLGSSYDTAITVDDYSEMSAKWRNKINSLNADILCICEYNTNIVNETPNANKILAQPTVFGLFKYAMIGSKPSATSYMQTAIFSQFATRGYGEFLYKNTVQAGRYAAATTVNVGGKDVVIVSTHLDFNQGASGAEYREIQMRQLISMFSTFDHVIICADWNVGSSSEYTIFTKNGWKSANMGYLGEIKTYPAGETPTHAIDNIICKGVNVKQVGIINDDELSDHCCIWADIIID